MLIYLLLILFFFTMPPLGLLILAVIVINHWSSRKKRSAGHGARNFGPISYPVPPRSIVQRTGWMPWIVVGTAFVIGSFVIALVPMKMYRASEHAAEPYEASSRFLATGVAYADTNPTEIILTSYESPQEEPEEKEVEKASDTAKPPKKKAGKASASSPKAPKPKAAEAPAAAGKKAPSAQDKKAEPATKPDDPGTSALLDSVWRAAMQSFQEKSPEEIAEKIEKFTAKSGKPGPAIGAADVKKSVNAVQDMRKALMTELPEGINREKALKALGHVLGRAIAAENTPRPPWVDQPSGVDPKTGNYRAVVTVGPYLTQMECEHHLNDKLHKMVEDYVIRDFGPMAQGRIHLSSSRLHQLIHRSQQELLNTKVGPMVNLHVEMVFDAKAKALLREQIRESLARERITWSMTALGCVSLFLLGAFTVLKFDPLYQRRIMIAVGAGVVVLLGLGILALV